VDRQTGRQTGGQMDMTKLTVAFRNFMNGPKMESGIQESELMLIFYTSLRKARELCI
jgi:hypothetical protein